MISINNDNVFKKKSSVEAQKVGTDYILFLHDKNKIVNLNSTSSFVWELIISNTPFSKITEEYISFFSRDINVNKIDLQDDVKSLIETLLENEIIEITTT